jgi:serine/threonine-protein kinase
MTITGPNGAQVREGDVLVGKYRVERVLGVGGMGVVVAAHHLQLEEKVALKFLLPHALANKDAVGRFLREARAAVRIKSEHVARVTDVGTLPDGAPFMVMEYLEGEDLAARLKSRGPMPLEDALDFVLQACVAVADAHTLGIVHRDLKPDNLFCVRRSDGQQIIKVLDFGISKMAESGGAAGAALTATATAMGTPLYMSPEQIRSSKDVDGRADLWALGVILHELLAGTPPFRAETLYELLFQITSAVPPPIRTLRGDVPPEVEAVLLRCLEKDPTRRFANVGELAAALARFAPARSRGSLDRISGIMSSAAPRAQPSQAVLTPAQAPQSGPSLAPSVPATGSTLLTMSGSGRQKSSLWVGLAIGGFILLGMVGIGLIVRARMRPAPAAGLQATVMTADSAAVAASSAPSPVSEPPSPVAPSSAASAGTPAAVAASSAVPVASSPSVDAAGASKKKRGTGAAAGTDGASAKERGQDGPPAAVKPPSPPSNCDPPYYFDANGTRLFKKECI